jgi:hypothetical protein
MNNSILFIKITKVYSQKNKPKLLTPKNNDSKIYNKLNHREHQVHRGIKNHLKGAFNKCIFVCINKRTADVKSATTTDYTTLLCTLNSAL